MAKSKSFLGDINIHSFKLGTKDIKLYLGDNLIYPTSTSLAYAVVTCESATYNAQTQIAEEITVVLSGNTLTKDVDYNVTQNSGGINAGSYKVEVTGINNYEGTVSSTFTIDKVTPTVTAPTPLTSLVYNGNAQALINSGSTNWGALQYSLDNSTYSASIPSGTNATAYTVYYRVVGDSNINDVAAQSVSVSISKVTPTVVAPTPKVLTYNGSSQELANAGSTDFGTLKYKVGSDSWSTSVPTRTRSGSYELYYKVDGDSNVYDVPSASTTCSINEKQVTATVTLSQTTYTYNGSACEPTPTVKDGTTVIDPIEYTVTYSNNVNAGTATVIISDNVGGNYEVIGSATFTINKANQSAPTATGDKVYEGSAATATASGGGGQGSLEWSNGSTRTAIGSQTTKARWSGNGNYNASSWSNEVTLEVIEKVVVVAKFNVTSTSSPTPISFKDNYYDGTSGFSEIEIDGVVQPSVVSAYTFSTTGEHTVKYTLKYPTSIGNFAFYHCSSLTSIVIPDSVTSIGNFVFQSCTGLTSVTIGNSVTSIGVYAFQGCSGLTSVTIPNSVTSISDYTFTSCSSLTSVTIPNSVRSIGAYAFDGCSSLTSIVIPSGVTSIGVHAFYDCSSLTSINIPSGVTSINASTFHNCRSLTSIDIPSGVTSIYQYAFNNCTSLTSINIPSGVTRIDGGTFYNCTSLTSITIPDSVTSIGDTAFYNCTSLTSVTIPNSVTNIVRYAFSHCSSLTSIDIPDSVTSVGEGAFANCSSIASCTIGTGVTSIGFYAFQYCTNLTSIICNATTAPTIKSYTFQNIKTGGTLTVPRGSTGYDVWMVYLGDYNWTKVEQ